MTKTQERPSEVEETTIAADVPRYHAGKSALAFDDRDRTIAWMTRTIHRLYNSHAQRILDREGVTIAHWYYLRVLAQRGTLNQLELSKRVGIASTTAVTALDSLEKRGLLLRTRDANDRRKYFVSITVEGRRLIDELMPDIEQMLVDSVQGIPATDMQTFWSVMQRIVDNLTNSPGGESVLD